MKKILLVLCLTSLIACTDDESASTTFEEETEIVEEEMLTLPDATQEGLGTFGCLVNGEVFIEDDDPFNTLYAEVGGDFYFITGAFNLNGPVRQIRIEADQNTIEEGMTYPLGVVAPGGYFAEVLFFDSDIPVTTEADAGSLTITKLDPENKIVSGTFSFDIMNNQGAVVEIRQGRFDQTYDD